jgi:hypothetical protein
VKFTSGYNAVYVLWEGFGFPNSLQPAPGAPPLSWDAFFTNLKAAGARRLRVKLPGWNRPIGTRALSYEPGAYGGVNPSTGQTWKYGEFNDWGGRLQDAVTAARTHGIGFQVIPFDRQEFMQGWPSHAWHTQNGGFLIDPRKAFSDPRAIQAAKARLDAIQLALGDPALGNTVDCWEICAEMSFMIKPAFWGVPDWGAMAPIVHNVLVPWVEDMAQHIKAISAAPVGNGNVFAPNGFNSVALLRNEVYRTPSLDYALINWYGDEGPMKDKLVFLRACQEYTKLPIYVEQYAPWVPKPDAPYTREPPDYSWSKEMEWAAACGESGVVGPLRWPEIKPTGQSQKWWGVASPEMAEIAGTTHEFAQVVGADEWKGRGLAWDDRIAGATRYVSSWSDGFRAVAFLRWQADQPHDLTVRDLPDGGYTARTFDWLKGDLVNTVSVASVGGRLSLFNVPARNDHSVLYIAPQDTPPAPKTITLRVTAPDGAAQDLDLEAGQAYTLEVVES